MRIITQNLFIFKEQIRIRVLHRDLFLVRLKLYFAMILEQKAYSIPLQRKQIGVYYVQSYLLNTLAWY